MTLEDLKSLIQHTWWANQRILSSCSALSHDEFVRAVQPDPGWGSVRRILVHALDAEYGWRKSMQGDDASAVLTPEDFADVAQIRHRWAVEHRAWQAFLAQLREADLSHHYAAEPGQGMTIGQTILHVVLHSAQHRSEVAAVLTGYGHSPGDLDFDMFLRADG